MATLHISLSDQLKDFVRSVSMQEGYSNYSDYIRHLIRGEREKIKKERREKEKYLAENMSNEFIRAVQRISNLSIDDEQKKERIQTYALSEVKRKNPISDDDFIRQMDKMSKKAQERGLTPEILESIINEK